MREMKTASVDFDMKGLRDIKLHQVLTGVSLKHPLKGYHYWKAFRGDSLKIFQHKNWIIKATSVVRSTETFRELRNRFGLELPLKTTVHPPL